jgi:hypothetical protein
VRVEAQKGINLFVGCFVQQADTADFHEARASYKEIFILQEKLMAKRYSFGWKTASSVKEKANGKCFYCNLSLPSDTHELDDGGKIVSSKRNWHVDHMLPLSRGGDHSLDNLTASCGNCNLEKGVMTSEEYISLRRQ